MPGPAQGANPVVHAQIFAEMAEFGRFEEVTGGEVDGVKTDYYEAGRLSPRKIDGTHSYTNLVLTRAFDPQRDALLIDWVTQVLLGARPDKTRTVVKHVQNALGIPIAGAGQTYPNCKPTHIKTPDGRAGDSSIAQIVVTMAVEAQR